MFSRFFHLIYNPRILLFLGIIVALVLLYDYVAIKTFITLVGILLTCTLLGLLSYYIWQKRKKAAGELTDLVEDTANEDKGSSHAKDENAQEVQALREQMQDAIKTIRKSKIGDQTGKAALYELPWYMVIGNPAAGKSSAVLHSGLKFPFMEKTNKLSVKGIGGTRNCDWFFSTEGILLDTAGRYSAYEDDRSEWLSFLNLLKKNRPKAPINGIIIAVSIAELTKNDPSYALDLAKNLRSRVQDLTEQLEVYAPVYVVFTKMDLISGFRDFFNDYEQDEREQVWGATIPYPEDPDNINLTEVFEEHFGVLVNGLKDLSTTKLSLRHQRTVSPSLMTFPMEFQSLRPMIRTLMHALFEDNPFQFKPILRGFYFTSALQEGQVSSQMTLQMVQNYDLRPPAVPLNTQQAAADKPYFLHDLFSKVILKDKHLVKQHKNRNKRGHRALATLAAVVVLCAAAGLWTWSYANNKQLTERVEADLQQVAQIQKDSNGDLQSQLESLTILQSRIEQLEGYDKDRPLSLGFGLYQGAKLKQKLLTEYYNGIGIIVLAPTTQNVEKFLTEVNTNVAELTVKTEQTAADEVESQAITNDAYIQSDPTDVEDAYNALKAYLMLANHDHFETSHLSDQMTRFWRTWLEANRADMPRDKMIRQAERILSFTLAHADDPAFPLIQNDLGLVDKTRSNLSKVSKGMPARERVYTEIKLRSSARFPAVTVAQMIQGSANEALVGGYVISGTFTKQAWESFVSNEIDKAATNKIVADDWVLATSSQDDLTLTGSPEQIRQYLVNRYKQEYITEWKRFLSQVYIRDSADFSDHAVLLNQLSNATDSPLKTLFETVDRQTQWDNQAASQPAVDGSKSRRSFVNWFKQTILRQSPSELRQAEAMMNNNSSASSNADVTASVPTQTGIIAQEFSSIHALVTPREDNQNLSLLDNYLVSLGDIRTRFNNITRSGDIGPDALLFASQTLGSEGSELTKSLQILDEQILSQANSEIKQLVRPLLSDPLTRSFNMLLKPTKNEINKVWQAQVHKPFMDNLGNKYPFTANANLEATPAEIGQFFGEDGYVAKFVNETLSPFIIRRGDQISSKIWNGAGLGLSPQFVADFGRYFVNYTGGNRAGGSGESGAASAANQTTFQIMPLPVSGLTEYTFVLDGQQLRYRMGTQAWTTFMWPNPSSQPGASIKAKDYDGKDYTIFEEAGGFGVEKLINEGRRTELGDKLYEMAWTGDGITVPVRFRIISGNASTSSQGQSNNPFTGMKLPNEVIALGVTRTAQQMTPDDKTTAESQIATSTTDSTASNAGNQAAGSTQNTNEQTPAAILGSGNRTNATTPVPINNGSNQPAPVPATNREAPASAAQQEQTP